MIKLNNKGQSLVLFVIFIPILLGIIALVIDVGSALSVKSDTDDKLELVLNYGLDNSEVFFDNDLNGYYNEEFVNELDDLKLLLSYNLENNQNKVVIEDNSIIISSNTYVEGIFSNILKIKGFKIESKYKGYIKNEKKVIEKIK